MELELPGCSLTWILAALLPILIYLYHIRQLSVFKKMGVPAPRQWPIVGDFFGQMKRGLWAPDYQVEMMRQYGKVYGVYSGSSPILIVSDPEMLREIFIKQFHNFSRRNAEFMTLNTIPSGRYLINLSGEDWKNIRTTITPAFSTGKLKQMVGQLNRCANILADTVGGFANTDKPFKARELTGGFTMDAIASTAFGTEIDSQRNPEDPFVIHGRQGFKFDFRNPILWLWIFFPKIMRPILEATDWDFFPRKSYRFFENVFDQLMDMRQQGGIERVDFMQLMANAHKEKDEEDEGMEEVKVHGQRKALTKADVVSNGILFFLAGYDTTASTMAYTMYNLALNQEAQDTVIQEVDNAMEGKDDVDHEAVGQLTYLEMCIMETLRLYPPGANVMTRCSVEDTVVKGLSIPKGVTILTPVQAIHYDPERWPEPKKFIPERFTKEEREKRNPFDWLPFGAGPRSCIGMRLALLEAKIGLAKVFMKYRILPCQETQIPLKMKKHDVFPTAEDGVMLKATPRNQSEN
ncbi:PREDICTED: cytochrome P450 3A29-like [Branchiostoma belcheri]|uniref:Cytochrome P450 3A29-like n=1 Tax=Branchiostoma belcheri TaxID=7741 RepID=A0A6P4YQT6_BRABE|nr:PREDICTED: cytochrome P450 3A29-like [Branchiostoma belcheri]